MVSVRFTPAELATVQEHAGGPLSGYLRRVALASARPAARPVFAVNVSATDERLIIRSPLQGHMPLAEIPATLR